MTYSAVSQSGLAKKMIHITLEKFYRNRDDGTHALIALRRGAKLKLTQTVAETDAVQFKQSNLTLATTQNSSIYFIVIVSGRRFKRKDDEPLTK